MKKKNDMLQFMVHDIAWDFDDEEVSLPGRVVIEMSRGYADSFEDFDEAICEPLTAKYGFCIRNFAYRTMQPSRRLKKVDIVCD